MFKVGKLEDTNNIEVKLDTVVHTMYDSIKDEHIKYDVLSFEVVGELDDNEYVFSFELNCKTEDLLELEIGKTIDLKKYIFDSETMFTCNGVTDMDPKYDITINRYMNNKYVVLANIFMEISNETNSKVYASIIEFDFNLDEYI